MWPIQPLIIKLPFHVIITNSKSPIFYDKEISTTLTQSKVSYYNFYYFNHVFNLICGLFYDCYVLYF